MNFQRARQRGSMLFAVYLIASLIPISLIGVMTVSGDAETAQQFGRYWGRAQSALIEQMVIAPALGPADLSNGLSAAERKGLEASTDLAIFNGTVARLRLRSFEGRVEFSDDGTTTGAVPISDPAFRIAAAGGTDVRIFTNQAPAQDVVRVLRPVIAAANGQATGVLEVYLPYDAIASQVQAETRSEMIRMALSLAGLFGVLALISWWTTRSLRQIAAMHEYDSLHDSMTGLPNRELFRRTAEDALERSRQGEQGALVLIDLDRFKEVNDTLGHQAGDELLKIVGRRLQESLRTDDTVARLGGDEFAMVLPRGDNHRETLELLRRVRAELGLEVVLNGVSLNVDASFGVCFYPESAESVEDLLQHADAAMYQGKQGAGGIVVYQGTTPQLATHSLVIQQEFREALDRDELVLHYQPKVNIGSGRVTCVEALVRWKHPERGLLLPAEFLPVVERCELVGPLTDWVLSRALDDCRQWTAQGHDWMVSVNVSSRNLTSPQFADRVIQMLQEAGLPPDRLCLEVSETALAFDAELVRTAIGALAGAGISISIDHFGMGLRDLAQISTAHVSEVKIDRMFLADLPGDEQERAIVRSIIGLGHNLGCLVTAVGVESREVADALAEAGCDDAQGQLWLSPGPWTKIARAFGDLTVTSSP